MLLVNALLARSSATSGLMKFKTHVVGKGNEIMRELKEVQDARNIGDIVVALFGKQIKAIH